MNRRRIKGLNTLRALAVIGVLLYHAFPVVFSGGFFGVLLFFVISGYLSGYQTITAMKERTFSLGAYYRRRFLRIWPALIIVLLAGTAVLSRIDLYRLADTRQEVLSVLLGYNNYWQLHMNASYFNDIADASPFTHLWYIALLIQFEVFWPFLAFLYDRLRRSAGKAPALLCMFILTVISFVIMPVMVLRGKDLSYIYYATETRVFSLLAGAFSGILRAENMGMRPLKFADRYTPRIIVSAFIIGTLLLYLWASGSARIVYLGGMQLYTVLTCLVIEVMVQNRKHLRHFVDDRISNAVSSLSYELYLWQYPVLLFSSLLYPERKPLTVILSLVLIVVLSIWLHTFTSMLFRGNRRIRKAVRTA